MSDSKGGRGVNWTLTYLLLVAFSGVCLLGGYWAGETLLGRLVSELGIAGLVAFVLALTIERLSTTALQEEFKKLAENERNAIKRDVFHYVYGNILPQEIRDELDHYVLQSNFVRSDLYLQFELTIEKDPITGEEYVKSKCLTRSHIRNICGQSRIFPIKQSIDRSPSDALKGEVKYLEFSVSGAQDDFSLNESDLAPMTRAEDTKIRLVLSADRQVIVLPDQTTDLKIAYQGIRTLQGGGIYFFFTSHTCDLELTVNVMNRDLDVFAETLSPHELVETQRHDPDTGYYNWTLKKPLLSYQATHVSWKRRAAAQSPPTPALPDVSQPPSPVGSAK
jgi:hypothetical protein